MLASLMLFSWSQQPAQAGCGAILTNSMGSHQHMHLPKNKEHKLHTTKLAAVAKPSPPAGSEAVYEQSYERLSPDLRLGSQH